jgi:phosphatidylglycerol:prolipoprotein diacylglycerol transferase
MTPFGLFAAAGAVVAIFWLRLRHERLGVTENEFWVALWLMALGSVVGAKTLFVILGWEHYASGELRLWRDFGTGFVFFGGLIGAATVGLVFALTRKLSFWRGADYFAVAIPLAQSIGRVGCYFTGCCPGKAPHPVQLYESAGLILAAVISFGLLKRVEAGRLPQGSVFCLYGILYGTLRLVLDPFRADGRPERWLGISHQQGIAIGLILLSAGALLFLWKRYGFCSLRAQS